METEDMEWAPGLDTMSDGDSDSSRAASDDDSSDSDSQAGSEDSQPRQAAPRQQRAPGVRQLHPLMHLLANRQLLLAEPRTAASNEDLVQLLVRSDTLRKPELIAAMQACPRDLFVPENDVGREGAFADSPLALQLGFNVSAPHMHATCMEALDLQPGHAVLDVGCGCGILTAMMATVVGKSGQVWGIDCKKRAVALARKSVATLEAGEGPYRQLAGPVNLRQHNVFLPAGFMTGRYDRVHVGAACPPNRVATLRKLLKPSGGIIVTPVAPSDLQRISVNAEGHVRIETLSQVRYSNLEVPGDLEIVAAAMKRDRKARLAVPICPSTFEADVASMQSVLGSSSGSSASTTDSLWQSSPGSCDAGGQSFPSGRSPTLAPSSSWSKRFATRFLACSGISGQPQGAMNLPSSPTEGARACVVLDAAELGPHDMALTGPGWKVPVHRAVLRSRCDHFRARCDSGMRDALDAEAAVPEHFTKEAVVAFVRYCYEDGVEERMDVQSTLALLHAAHFFGAPRLAGLCDLALSRNFKHASASDEGTCDMACALLAVAEELGLAHLQSVTLDLIVHNYPAASACAGYAALTKGQTDLVTAEACRLVASMQRLMREVAC